MCKLHKNFIFNKKKSLLPNGYRHLKIWSRMVNTSREKHINNVGIGNIATLAVHLYSVRTQQVMKQERVPVQHCDTIASTIKMKVKLVITDSSGNIYFTREWMASFNFIFRVHRKYYFNLLIAPKGNIWIVST